MAIKDNNNKIQNLKSLTNCVFSSLTFLAYALNHGLTSCKVGFACQGSLPFE